MKKVIMALGVLAFANALMATDVKALVKGCAACHGVKFEKKALGKSKIVNMMSEKEIEEDLMAFKNGANKNPVMTVQAKKLSDEDIKALAKYIPTLK
ncbi:c-type cytochrome [Helicobacter pylori]|uniref:c-type cytochrome n=1 Tax=Helicobacter pylori TaxID=210 RepID=UPI0002BAEF0A|nr:cytochrome c [Helicobacter pylori]EMH08353.1 cytochrome C-553 [Helicobacter pylori GAM250AFi]EMH12179.1 cytochrome C-553 [Helicobacter pylori GAM252Bi]EMH12398.1 cytochrome C-553 [Helicobacter pylori GAM252T]EMH14362.1 cytochrome C-553 [Helicobacter pylori GAM250T]EMH47475.1 cytochrome C-553 [Helicobacter pylori HP250AFii]